MYEFCTSKKNVYKQLQKRKEKRFDDDGIRDESTQQL